MRRTRGWTPVPGLICCLGGLLVAASSWAGHPTPAPVPPHLEIEILDPGLDPRGNPAVIPVPSPDGGMRITIPPTVLVHRYYYTGDRTFQGPLLKGGPCIVVVNHPKNGEQLNIPVQMLPGSPRVTYRDHCIEYDYGSQGITITFCWLTGCPKVVYRQGVPLPTKVHNAAKAVSATCHELIARTSLPECKEKACAGAKNVVVTAVDNTDALTRIVLTPVAQVVRLLPGAKLLVSSPEARAAKQHEALLKREEWEARKDETIFVPTNR